MEFIVIGLVAAVVFPVVVLVALHRRGKRDRAELDDYAVLRGLAPTEAPLGHPAAWWMTAADVVPAGVRPDRVAIDAAFQGRTSTRIGGRSATVDVAAFRWRHWVHHMDAEGGPDHQREDQLFVAVRLPAPVPAHVILRDRALRRRRNHLVCDDPGVAAALTAPAVQAQLDVLLRHTAVELVGDLMVVTSTALPALGRSEHRGTAGDYDRLLGLADRVAAALPADVWSVPA